MKVRVKSRTGRFDSTVTEVPDNLATFFAWVSQIGRASFWPPGREINDPHVSLPRSDLWTVFFEDDYD
jgi:hypothetical protein